MPPVPPPNSAAVSSRKPPEPTLVWLALCQMRAGDGLA
jgi:hypothetical protein